MGIGKHSLFASKGCGQSLEHMEILIWLKSNSYVLLRVNHQKAGAWKAFVLGLASTVNIWKLPGVNAKKSGPCAKPRNFLRSEKEATNCVEHDKT